MSTDESWFINYEEAVMINTNYIFAKNDFKLSPVQLTLKTSYNAGLKNKSFIINSQVKPPELIRYAYKPLLISFKGNKKIEETTLYSQFKLSSNYPEKIYGFVKNANASPTYISEFLNTVTANPDSSKKFIAEITSDPKESKSIIRTLCRKLGSEKNYLNWFYGSGGYYDAYKPYLQDYFEKANSVEDLLKFSPNWGFWRLEEKYWMQNNPYQSKNLTPEEREIAVNKARHENKVIPFTIGKLPEEFGDRENFAKLVKKLDYGTNGTVSVYPKEFKVSQFSGGDKNYKNIFLVTAGNKDFIVKADRFTAENIIKQQTDSYYDYRTCKENKLLRGDSIFLDACMDFYLNANNSKNAPKIHFYDFDTNSSIYECVKGRPYKEGDGFINIVDLNNKLLDVNSLGVICNDTAYGNYRQGEDGNIKIIDIGHSSYIDGLKPGCNEYNIDTLNVCGRSLGITTASLALSNYNLLPDNDPNASSKPEYLDTDIFLKYLLSKNEKNGTSFSNSMIKQTLSVYELEGDHSGNLAPTLFELGNLYRENKHPDENSIWRKVIDVYSESKPDSTNLAQAYLYLGSNLFNENKKANYLESKHFFKQAIDIYRDKPDQISNYAAAYNNLGLVYEFMGEKDSSKFNKAERAFKKAASIYKNLDDIYENKYIETLSSLLRIYRQTNDTENFNKIQYKLNKLKS